MPVFYVMVCFLVACRGGSGVTAQRGTAVVAPASNQRPANELALHPPSLLDYANRGEKYLEPLRTEKISSGIRRSGDERRLIVAQDVRNRVDYAANGSDGEKRPKRDQSEFSSPETDQRLKFSYKPDENTNHWTNLFKRSPLVMMAANNGNMNNMETVPIDVTKVDTIPQDGESKENETVDQIKNASSPETDGRLKFSSVYSKADLDDKLSRKKQTFKNDLSEYLNDVVDTVKSTVNARIDSAASLHEYDNTRKPVGGVQPVVGGNVTEATIETEQREPDSDPETKGSSRAEEEARSWSAENQNNPGRKTTAVKANPELGTGRKNETTTTESRAPRTLLNVAAVGVPVAYALHQQSTNMKPTRTQHLEQNKRSTGEATLVKLTGYGMGGVLSPNRRQFTADVSPLSNRGNIQLASLNPIQLDAAAAYHNAAQPLGVNPFDGPAKSTSGLIGNFRHTLYQFNPAQINALRGVFDKGPVPQPNFQPIAPKQVAYVPPRLVYETKIIPTPFMPFRTEQKTVQALSSLLGQSPQKQLQGLNLILNKEQKGIANSEVEEPQDFEGPVAFQQNFVTPITPSDVPSILSDDDDDDDDVRGGDRVPSNHKSTGYHQHRPQGNIVDDQEADYRPIIEDNAKDVRLTQSVTGRPRSESPQPTPVWEPTEFPDVVETKEEGRYRPYSERGDERAEYAGKYMFGYRVTDHESGNDFGHEETRDGEVTNGRYHVLLPDGRIQNVKYHVDHEGYHAKVSYQLDHRH